MKVIDINSRRLFGQFYPQTNERVPEGVRFVAGALLTVVAPTLAYSYVTNQTEQLYIMACQLVIGTLAGISLYLQPFTGPDSCVPEHRAAKATDKTRSREKDAA
ncbi:MAG TPA: hypothetical protein VK557_09720 [Pyrinomonadaceae bacterium]|nr:hypothetical protein [Pyrinomonadaceae bacterium]